MTASTSFAFLLPSVVLRAIGNAVLWIYAILLVQYRVPNDIQGALLRLATVNVLTASRSGQSECTAAVLSRPAAACWASGCCGAVPTDDALHA